MVPGFEEPRTARDDYALALWREHGLSHPSMAQIEPVFKKVYERGDILEAAAIVLGRNVSAEDTEVVGLVALTTDPNEAFGLLLMRLTVESS